MNTDTFHRRLAMMQRAMLHEGVDCFVAAPSVNMQYLTGFVEPAHERFMALLVPAEGEPVLIVPALSAESARQEAFGVGEIRVWEDHEGVDPILREVTQEMDLATAVIAIDEELPALFLLKLQQILPTALYRPGTEIWAAARIRKDEDELWHITQASRYADNALAAGLAVCVAGNTEREVACAIQTEIEAQGAEMAFGLPIVAAGKHSAQPHYRTTNTVMHPGDVVVIDYGARLNGYNSDMTRTVCIGEATPEVQKIYKIVYDAHYAARAAVKPGVTAESVDAAARSVIEKSGYGQFFVHRTGHGIGLSVHEPPYIVQGNKQVLEEGMCFSIEPGIYLPGQFGVRIENLVVVTADGCKSLNAEPPPHIREIG
ncbi:MAG: Xaa-Pro peptidase family protein [Armatimonadota bacterium]|nr:Xaa-Pro peptidase family protein [bacterium]MCS7308660.1 Xaa-Pro peptidase family protein [Armatimonadota bacterium]MDW8103898.1 Xaa-Pro peptidase family protein [Armatimonadota bacterium]MDW8289446.1 Xaa-Pro peptidase family protein [Armatimonadota bacterium]